MSVASALETRGDGRSVFGPDAKALVLFNPKAGGTTEADRAKLAGALDEAGIAQHTLVDVDHLDVDTFRHARSFDVIIVLGGDGTARLAAELAPRDAPPLVLLPGGTLNLLPHALYGELSWPDALREALTHGVVKRLTGGYANKHRFFIAAIFGGPTLLARAREAVREGHFISAWRRTRHFLKRAFSHRLAARPDCGPSGRAEAIGVLAPSFSGAVEGPDLEWVKLDTHHLIDLARVSLRALGAGWRNDPSVEISRCKGGEIRSRGVIPAVLDGEPKTFLARVRIRYDAHGPRVIALERE